MLRIVVAFTVAALWFPSLSYFMSGEYGPFWFFMIALYTAPLTLLVAVPLHYFNRKRITFLFCVLVGLGIGLLGVLSFWAMSNQLAAQNWAPLLIGTGIVSSVLFWVIGIWRNGYIQKVPTL